MKADGLVTLGAIDQLEPPEAISSRPDFYASIQLPLRTRAFAVIGLAILAWLPIIAVAYAITKTI